MTVRRLALDTVGCVIAGLAGVPYFLFTFGKAWDGRPDVLYLAGWLTLSILIVGAVIVVLTILLRPKTLWLYPTMFAGTIVLFGLSSLGEGTGPVWSLMALATIAAGWGWGHLTQVMSKRLAGPNRSC